MSINEIANEMKEDNHRKGFYWDWNTAPTALLLIHSEVSEATNDLRDDKKTITWEKDKKTGEPKPVGFPTEMADIIIRVYHLCAELNIDIDEAIRIKNGYNRTRPHHHGHKRF
jgi:hypothetical protein